ncbi:MAG: cell division protein SepF [Erysipelotrichaceae bacterium]|nr:cell division protein SepF [Erysipelotrichaceae bacterium]
MGFGEKIKEFIAPTEEVEELELSEDEAKVLSTYEEPQNEAASRISATANIVLFEPRNFDEAEEIGRHIKHKRACCINLQRMPSEYRQRIIDFLSGVVYGVDGSIKKIGDNVILCSPKNLQVAGNISLDGSDNY